MNSTKNLELLTTGSFEKNIKALRSNDLDETRSMVASIFCEHELSVKRKKPINYTHDHLEIGVVGLSYMGYGADVAVKPGKLGSFTWFSYRLRGMIASVLMVMSTRVIKPRNSTFSARTYRYELES